MIDKETVGYGSELGLECYKAYSKDVRRVSNMIRIVVIGTLIAGSASLAFYGNWLAYVMSIFVAFFAFISYGTFEGWINQRYFAKIPNGYYDYKTCWFNDDDSMK